MENIVNELTTFFTTGNNAYYVTAGVVALIGIILVIAICASRSKRKKQALIVAENTAEPVQEETPSTEIEIDAVLPTYDDEPEEEYPDGAIDVDKLEIYADDFKIPAGDAVVTKVPVRSNATAESVVMKPVTAPEPVEEEEPEPEPEHVPAEKGSNFNKDYIFDNSPVRRPGTVQIYKDAGGKFRFRFKSHNSETVGHSQGYTTKASCKAGIQAVINASKTAIVVDTTKDDKYVPVIGRSAFEVYRDAERKFRFRLTASNAINILASQGYTAKANCINGIESIRRISELHKVVDDTVAKK